MAVSKSFHTFVLEQLNRAVPAVRARRMFGGVGLYAGDVFFALIYDDAVYFKTDAATQREFTARGMEPFRPFGEEGGTMQYYQLPEDVLENPDLLRRWAEAAIEVGRRKPKRPSRRRRA